MQSEEIKEIYLRQVDMVWRISFTFLKNREEAKDAVQETFLRLMRSGQNFQDEKHALWTGQKSCQSHDDFFHWTDDVR